jgi:hypothetical protein
MRISFSHKPEDNLGLPRVAVTISIREYDDEMPGAGGCGTEGIGLPSTPLAGGERRTSSSGLRTLSQTWTDSRISMRR